jgi:4-amino-4-deoxy-L-arabinose transferase-like glycosyltransferase
MSDSNLAPSKRFKTGITILIGLITALIVAVCILSWVPPVSRDALTHHLAIPKIYLEKGGIVEIRWIGASYFPQNVDLLYMLPLYFGNDILAKYIHFTFALLTAWLIFGYLKKRIDTLHALFAVLLFLSLPVIVKLSITVYVDLGLIFFTTASLLLLFKWSEEGYRIRYLLLSAVFCGLALGTKYNGLIGFFLLTLFVPFMYVRNARAARKRQLRAAGCGLLFGAVALLVFSPWMIRNAVWTGNPLHPLFPGAFSTQKSTHKTSEADSRMKNSLPRKPTSPFWIRKNAFHERWWQIALIPVRVFFEGRDDDPRFFDGRLNPLLFFLPIFAFTGFRNNPQRLKTEKKLLLTFVVLFLLFTFFRVDMRIRYIAPIIPPLVILSAFGLQEIFGAIKARFSGRNQKLLTGAVLAAVAAGFAWNAVYVSNQFATYRPLDYISGRVGRDAYITRHRPAYPVLQYANRNTDKRSKILCLFQGHRRYYSDRITVHNEDLMRQIVIRAASAGEVARRLQKRKFTHLLIHFDMLQQWSQTNFTGDEIERLNEFFRNHTRKLTANGSYVLLELTLSPQPTG